MLVACWECWSVYLKEFPLQTTVLTDLIIRIAETPLAELPVLAGPADQPDPTPGLHVLHSLENSSDLETGD